MAAALILLPTIPYSASLISATSLRHTLCSLSAVFSHIRVAEGVSGPKLTSLASFLFTSLSLQPCQSSQSFALDAVDSLVRCGILVMEEVRCMNFFPLKMLHILMCDCLRLLPPHKTTPYPQGQRISSANIK